MTLGKKIFCIANLYTQAYSSYFDRISSPSRSMSYPTSWGLLTIWTSSEWKMENSPLAKHGWSLSAKSDWSALHRRPPCSAPHHCPTRASADYYYSCHHHHANRHPTQQSGRVSQSTTPYLNCPQLTFSVSYCSSLATGLGSPSSRFPLILLR